MDLQAILDASDSSDDDYGTTTASSRSSSLPTIKSSRERYHHPPPGVPSTKYSDVSADIDLEQILREDDDDDDSNADDDGDDDRLYAAAAASHFFSSHPNQQNNNESSAIHYDGTTTATPTTKTAAATNNQKNHRHNNDNNMSHNAEEWAVLQAILREGERSNNDDDDDDDDDYHSDDDDYDDENYDYLNGSTSRNNTANSRGGQQQQQQQQHLMLFSASSSNSMDESEKELQDRASVEALLSQEDDTTENIYNNNNNNNTHDDYYYNYRIEQQQQQHATALFSNGNSYQPSSSTSSNNNNTHHFTTTEGLEEKKKQSSGDQRGGGGGGGRSSSPRGGNNQSSSTSSRQLTVTSQMWRTTSAAAQEQSAEAVEAEASRRALERAQAHEYRLFHKGSSNTNSSTAASGGHHDYSMEIVSPLMVKRRLKPKIELTSRVVVPTLHSSLPQNGSEQQAFLLQQQQQSHSRQHQQQSRHHQHSKSLSSLAHHHHHHHNVPRFNFSGVVENKTVPDISASLVKHSTPQPSAAGGDGSAPRIMCGLPTCLAFNSRFIAVGTQLSIILLYDLFGALRQRLGATSANGGNEETYNVGGQLRLAGPITSLDLASNGECCVAGYKSGLLLLWDVIRGTVLRSVDDVHPSPITLVRFLAVADLKMITVDSGGLVHKLSFTKNLLWSTYSMESECLLDGTAGQILAMDVLEPFSLVNPHVRPTSSAGLVRVLRCLSLIALSSERSSFAVAVEPRVNVLHRWARPPDDRRNVVISSQSPSQQEQQTYLPCLSWGWGLVSGGGHVVMPILARAWGCCLQLLCASFPSLDDHPDDRHYQQSQQHGFRPGEEPAMHWPAFGVHHEVDAETPIVALEWLSERSLVYLTLTNEFTLVDTVMFTLLERIDFSGLRLVYAEFSLSRNSSQNTGTTDATSTLASDNDAPASSCTTFQNTIRCSDNRLMVLCQEELRRITIVGARQRISALESDGEWLEALALALDHYESTIVSQEDKRRHPSGLKDLSRHPEFLYTATGISGTQRGEEEEWIAKLLIRYLNLAVENAPESDLHDDSATTSSFSPPRHHHYQQPRIDLARSHFQMLAGVCVEFCVVTRRLDLLFGPIFRRFQNVGYTAVFLDVLEPYVLNDKLKYIAPEVMSYFVEHCKATNGVATVERCLLHMDCTIMDFDTILSLLRSNNMYSALFYVFNQGLDDYVTPLEILLEKVFDEADTGSMLRRRRDRSNENQFELYGYKSILYLQTCFKGKTFPKEDIITPEERQKSVKPELVNFLMQKTYSPSPHAKRKGGTTTAGGQSRAQRYPYMRILLQLDPRLAFETVSLALDSPDAQAFVAGTVTNSDDWENGDGRTEVRPLRYPSKQEAVDVFLSMVLPELASPPIKDQVALVKSRSATSFFLDFAAKYIVRGVVRMDKAVNLMIVKRMADRFSGAKDATDRQTALKEIMELLSSLPRDAYDPDKVLALIEKASIHRAALLLHQQVASSWQETDSDDAELRSQHFRKAIECFLEDDDPDFRKEVFDYVRKECSGAVSGSEGRHGGSQSSLRDALYSTLPGLVRLDAFMTARIVAELFVEDLEAVVDALDTGDGGHAQFLFFQSIISGDLMQRDQVAGTVLNLTMSHHHKYLELMVRLHPELVYGYLSTHDCYRADDALRLCQEHDIADASAYLLERMGNVSSALQLILQTLESRMMGLKRTIRGISVDVFRRQDMARDFVRGRKGDATAATTLPTKQEKEVQGVKRILVVALDLCERNSGSFAARTEHGSQLWFNVLDRLINSKGFLRLSNEQPVHAQVMAGVLSELLRLAMQRMVSSVPLTDLVRKVTSDHSGSRLGELREMVESLLGTYGFELKVFRSACSVFYQDVQRMQADRRRLQLQGSPVRAALNLTLEPSTRRDLGEVLRDTQGWSGTLQVGNNGNATFVQSERHSRAKGAESGLAMTLHRLRSRRRHGDTANATRQGGGSIANMMTVTEQLYHEGELEPVVYFGERPIGLLGEAEHRGRLMTFQ